LAVINVLCLANLVTFGQVLFLIKAFHRRTLSLLSNPLLAKLMYIQVEFDSILMWPIREDFYLLHVCTKISDCCDSFVLTKFEMKLLSQSAVVYNGNYV